jgi:hypothetical protein
MCSPHFQQYHLLPIHPCHLAVRHQQQNYLTISQHIQLPGSASFALTANFHQRFLQLHTHRCHHVSRPIDGRAVSFLVKISCLAFSNANTLCSTPALQFSCNKLPPSRTNHPEHHSACPLAHSEQSYALDVMRYVTFKIAYTSRRYAACISLASLSGLCTQLQYSPACQSYSYMLLVHTAVHCIHHTAAPL